MVTGTNHPYGGYSQGNPEEMYGSYNEGIQDNYRADELYMHYPDPAIINPEELATFPKQVKDGTSYPKQPDRTVVNYVEYTKEAKAEPEAEVQPKEQAAIEASQTEEQTNDEAAAAQPETAVNSNTVSENRRNDKMRKE